jgi:hypothetical protein
MTVSCSVHATVARRLDLSVMALIDDLHASDRTKPPHMNVIVATRHMPTKCSYGWDRHSRHPHVNGQVVVPAGGQLEVPTLALVFSWFWVSFLCAFGLVSCGRSRRR